MSTRKATVMQEFVLVCVVVAASHAVAGVASWGHQILFPSEAWHAQAQAFDRAVMAEYHRATATPVFDVHTSADR